MEAFGDGVVAGEAPQPDDLLGPIGEGFSEGDGVFEAAGSEGLDEAEEGTEMSKRPAGVRLSR